MHRLRRFAALLLATFALQFALLGAGAECLMGGAATNATSVDAGHGAHADHDAHASHAAAADAPAPSSGGAPHHDGDAHCPAAVGCATAIVAEAPIVTPAAERLLAAAIARPAADAPASAIGAPEPPPPRA